MTLRLAQYWAAQFWPVSVQVAVFVAFVCAISVCLRRFPARYKYILWLLVLARLAIPATIASPWGMGQYPEKFFVMGIQWLSGHSTGISQIKPGTGTPVAVQFQPISNFSLFLFFVWVSGIVAFIVAVLARILRFNQKKSLFVPVQRPDLIALSHRLAGRVGCRDNIKLLQANDAGDAPFPLVSGVFRSSIILPADMASNWTSEALEPVLIHELIHIKRRDALVNLVQMVFQILYFYHPMVWLANWALRSGNTAR
jgi:bla regulator protein blaR1